ncbi:MAG: hypothetical protein EBW51_07720, partial [Actinobacteria bacterium]|nr:hypothetical protein [Actinomycetota bacterium]
MRALGPSERRAARRATLSVRDQPVERHALAGRDDVRRRCERHLWSSNDLHLHRFGGSPGEPHTRQREGFVTLKIAGRDRTHGILRAGPRSRCDAARRVRRLPLQLCRGVLRNLRLTRAKRERRLC